MDDTALPLFGEMLRTLRSIESMLREALTEEEPEPLEQHTLEGESAGAERDQSQSLDGEPG